MPWGTDYPKHRGRVSRIHQLTRQHPTKGEGKEGLMYVFEEYLASIGVLIAFAILLFGTAVLVLLIMSGAEWLAEKSQGTAGAVRGASHILGLPLRLLHGHHASAHN